MKRRQSETNRLSIFSVIGEGGRGVVGAVLRPLVALNCAQKIFTSGVKSKALPL